MKYKSIKVSPKIEVKDKETLSLVYTPGVGAACKKIEESNFKRLQFLFRKSNFFEISSQY